MKPKFFLGPMSKNVVDSIIKFCNKTNIHIGIIPSRRQIEWNGGYVNNWTTSNFNKYINQKTSRILLQRDHAGPGQGQDEDLGFTSLLEDCKYFDLIHIDPWKKYPMFSDGLDWTVEMIEFCYNQNPKLKFEVGTEESIRYFDHHELEELLSELKNRLLPKIYNQINYLVIQSGTSLKGTNQTGEYDSERLRKMIRISKKFNFFSKEHNGDYILTSIIKEKFELGLDCINIAPEFGLIETQTYLDEIKDDEIIEQYFDICYKSKRWAKWVNKDFDPFENKIELIQICGHYILSNIDFISEIKSKFTEIDNKIQNNILKKLEELYGY